MYYLGFFCITRTITNLDKVPFKSGSARLYWIEKQWTADLYNHTRRRSWWGCWQCCADEFWWWRQARPCAESSWTQSGKSLESTGTWDWLQPCPTAGRTVKHLALRQACTHCAVPQSLLLSSMPALALLWPTQHLYELC